MSTTLTHDLHDQLSRAIDMLRFTMRLFSPEEYITGLDFFDTPARLAWHTIESLDLYFTDGEASAGVDYGYRFGGTPHWKLPDEAMPAQGPMLEYLEEVEARIEADFSSLRDEDLSTPFERYDWSGKTLFGHYVYAIRHTMEHHGQLCVIATHFGHTEESWR